MDNKIAFLEKLWHSGVVAVMRADDPGKLKEAAAALAEGGIIFIEVTMTTPGALKTIEDLAASQKNSVIGAGSVLDAETARLTILSGAEFVVSPAINSRVIELCRRYSKIVIPGAFTPTEVITAWQAGADLVKIFPASLGGPDYIRALLAPLPQVRLLPTGGVEAENVADFIKAGSYAVAAGGNLVSRHLLKQRDFQGITELARKFVTEISRFRNR
ncbi:MAG: bifunctional 4-hydroxy-2-oxoglutarate aldolase/2-dehydro-3-deoxy-phosphogluconate aldolase [Candidatus Omnitrophica bacterium]|nr:bifunctional 4-hydroxy-2-oxoglutarate aldolase/2-dehydro-3-deoxy-phosphogluconate aldolase [Candidatus Omnitrophota bacterium]